MIEITSHDEMPDLFRLAGNVSVRRLFPQVYAALATLASMAQETWRMYASGRALVPGADHLIRSRGPYTRSIQTQEMNFGAKWVVYTDFRPHIFIETGHGEIDLKRGLLGGSKVRMGKNGPYNIVAFRHDTPSDSARNPMPKSIYQTMRENAMKSSGPGTGPSRVIRASPDPLQRVYQWGFRFDSKSTWGQRTQLHRGLKHGPYTWKSGKYSSMVRMLNKASGGSRGSYLTFRVVSLNSDENSWVVPPLSPVPIRQGTLDFIRQTIDINSMIRSSMEVDLK